MSKRKEEEQEAKNMGAEEKKEEVDIRKEIERLEKELKELKEKLGIEEGEERFPIDIPVEKAKEITTRLMDMIQGLVKITSSAAVGAIEGAKKELEKLKEEEKEEKKEEEKKD